VCFEVSIDYKGLPDAATNDLLITLLILK
jgi:hypothetical protein